MFFDLVLVSLDFLKVVFWSECLSLTLVFGWWWLMKSGTWDVTSNHVWASSDPSVFWGHHLERRQSVWVEQQLGESSREQKKRWRRATAVVGSESLDQEGCELCLQDAVRTEVSVCIKYSEWRLAHHIAHDSVVWKVWETQNDYWFLLGLGVVKRPKSKKCRTWIFIGA